MDYKQLQSLMESGNAEAVISHLQGCLTHLRDQTINPELPAHEYKVNALAKQKAVETIQHMISPFVHYESHDVRKKLQEDNLYYTHLPKVKT